LQVVKTLSGTLLDSEVAGVHFVTATQSGDTGEAGQFHFMPGEAITFSIGDIVLGQAVGGDTLTPLDLVGHGDLAATTNLLRFLQTLDANHNPDDGITISETARLAAMGVKTLNFHTDVNTFAADTTLKTFLNAATGQETLVTTDAAWNHFQNTLVRVAATSGQGVFSTSPANPTAIEDQPFAHTVPVGDYFPDLDNPHLTATTLSGDKLPDWLYFDAQTNTFAGTPHNSDVGVTALRMTAQESGSTEVSRVVYFTVANVNDAPVMAQAPGDLTAILGQRFQTSAVAAMFADVDPGDKLVYAISALQGTLPDWLAFDPGTGTLTGTPRVVDQEGIDFSITATDLAGASTSGVIHLRVMDPNLSPKLVGSLEGITATEETPFLKSLAGLFTDPEGGDVHLALATLTGTESLPKWLSFDADTLLLSGQPGNADVGTLTLRLTATDDVGKSTSTPFTLVVNNVNDAPQITTALVAQSATEETAFRYALPAKAFTDLDLGDHLTLTATLSDGSKLPTWLSFDPETAIFSGTPGGGDRGILSIRVKATDTGQESVSAGFQLSVSGVNHAPTLNATAFPSDRVIQEDQPFSLILPVNSFLDQDAGTTLVYSAQSLPSWLHFDAETRTLSGNPSNSDVGLFGIKITANDGSGGSATGSFKITVTNLNDAPQVASTLPEQILALNQKFSLQIPDTLFQDIDAGDRLKYSATLSDGKPLPSWLVFDADTRSFLGTPTGSAETLDIKLTAK
ncbi:MAG: putative Ig domain-containing protein, partial [Magnetococcales bacterium]|nr:putative Ig domain-containing protein [Magnetococcales bacterium]